MAEWTAVQLTQARQVAAMAGMDEALLPEAARDVRSYYDGLRRAGDLLGALDYLGHALPRREGIAWAAHLLDAESRTRTLPFADRLALDTAMRWLGAPDDTHRRAARDAAKAAGKHSAEGYLGMAVFCSGGSISDPGLPSVPAPPEASCRYVVAAVQQAAYRSDAPDEMFDRALRLGEAVAERGLASLG